MKHTFSDEELVFGMINNDKDVLDYLYNNVGPSVKRTIIRMGGEAEEAEDIFQEGMVAAYVNIKSKKYMLNDNTKFTSYLTQLCKYKWYDLCKSAHRSKVSQIDKDFQFDGNIQEDMEEAEKIKEIRNIINKLGDRCRKILQLFYWKRMSMEDIATQMQMTASSAKNAKYLCMKELKGKSFNNKLLK